MSNSSGKARIGFFLTQELADDVKRQCRRHGLTLEEFFDPAVRSRIEQLKSQQPPEDVEPRMPMGRPLRPKDG
jgi:hypothetical protein